MGSQVCSQPEAAPGQPGRRDLQAKAPDSALQLPGFASRYGACPLPVYWHTHARTRAVTRKSCRVRPPAAAQRSFWRRMGGKRIYTTGMRRQEPWLSGACCELQCEACDRKANARAIPRGGIPRASHARAQAAFKCRSTIGTGTGTGRALAAKLFRSWSRPRGWARGPWVDRDAQGQAAFKFIILRYGGHGVGLPLRSKASRTRRDCRSWQDALRRKGTSDPHVCSGSIWL